MSRPAQGPASNDAQCVPELTTLVYIVPRSRMSGGLPLIPLYAVWRGQENIAFTYYCYVTLLLVFQKISHVRFFSLFNRQRTVNYTRKD